jgi:protein SCO1/2
MISNESTNGQSMQGSKRDWLKRVGGALALGPALAASLPVHAAPQGPRAGYFPNTQVTTHEGKNLRFYDDVVRGRTVLYNMMYSVCTGICPGNTANLLQVQEALGSRLGKDIFMVSMTLQPELDTPEALRDYVKRYSIKPGWTFLTGRPQEMEAIRRKLGFFNPDPGIDSDLTNHTGMVRIGNEKLDRWTMMPALGSPKQIVRAVLEI